MNHRIAIPLLFLTPLLGACFQALDSGASRGSSPEHLPIGFGEAPDPGNGTIPTSTQTPEIQVVTDIGAGVIAGANTSDPCKATSMQAAWILMTYCGNCHSSKGASINGIPPFGFIDDTAKLLDPSNPTDLTSPPVPFLVKGDPKGSRIYQRIVLGNQKGAMPPVYNDPTIPALPRPNVSDFSVLHQWIKNCL